MACKKKKIDSGGFVDRLTQPAVALATSLIHVTPVHTILTNTDSFPAPINGRVEPLNANDSPLILIRETHQIQMTFQINRQVQGRGHRGQTLGQLSVSFSTTWIQKSKSQALHFYQTASWPRSKIVSSSVPRFSPDFKLVRSLHNIITKQSSEMC